MKHQFRKAMLSIAVSTALFATSSFVAADTGGASPDGVRYHGGDEIILQGFHWNIVREANGNWYNILNNMAGDIKNDGFTAIWMPVPWRDFSSWSSGGNSGGGEGYFWTDFNKNGQYGSDSQLQAAAATLNNNGIKVIYDIVPNHHNRGAGNDGWDLPAGQGYYRDDCANSGNNGGNDCDDGDRFIGGESDLNTAHPTIYNRFRDELSNLKNNYSAGGFRFDFVRGYAPERVDAWMGDAFSSGYCVGELWKAPNEYPSWHPLHSASWQEVIKNGFSDPAKCSVFDFALKERFQNGSVASWKDGLNGNPSRSWREVAVTFVDNHDTGYSPGQNGGQHHWPLADNKLRKAYAYILSSPGTPVVYWSHMYDWGYGDFLRALISARKDAGIKAYSSVSFESGFSGLVGVTTGDTGALMFAMDSNLSNPNQIASGNWTQVVNSDGARVWKKDSGTTGTVDVAFTCENGTTDWGVSVYAIGNQSELGNWSPAGAVKLDPSNYPTWTGTITLDEGANVQWKCIKRSESNPNQVIQWESGANNTVTANNGASTTGGF